MGKDINVYVTRFKCHHLSKVSRRDRPMITAVKAMPTVFFGIRYQPNRDIKSICEAYPVA